MIPNITWFNGTNTAEQTRLSGISFSPDSNGAADNRYFVEFINGVFAIYDKATGTPVGNRVSDVQFWQAAGIEAPASLIDPRIVFIQGAGRRGQWLAVQLRFGSLVYIATTDPLDWTTDPSLGKWKASSFPLPGNDFPMLGYDLDGIYIGSNTSLNAEERHPQIVYIPRANALAWPPRVGPEEIRVMEPLHGFAWTTSLFPVMDQSGAGWPYETAIAVDKFTNNHLIFALISHEFRQILSQGKIEVPPFTPVAVGSRVKQPFGWRDSNVIYDSTGIGSAPMGDGFNIWFAHTVLKPGSDPNFPALAVRWYRLSIDPMTRVPVLAAWGEIFQSGYDCFNPSILSFGKDDTTVVAFSRSGDPSTPSDPGNPACGNIGAYVALVHERAPDKREVFALRSGQFNNYIPAQAQRWGDYSTIYRDPDPTHPRRVWAINQYVLQGGASTSQWCEVIASIDVP